VASFTREYGGPAVSVPRLGVALSQQGIEVGLWAPDGSAHQADPGLSLGGVRCFDGALTEVIKEFGPNLIHDNGIWLPYNHRVAKTCLRFGIPRVVSARGMLEPWARRYKQLKKKIAWFAYQRRDLTNAVYIHTTSEEEETNIARLGLRVPVTVIPNGMDLPRLSLNSLPERQSAAIGERTALFLSRIHPIKGLAMLIDAWAGLRPDGWRLIIAGPDELGHSKKICEQVERYGLQNVISVVGPQYGVEKERMIRGADLFILPTHSENFGLVIAEALAYGLPVLTTKGAPWSGLKEHACGWWVDPTTEAIACGLKQAVETPSAELSEMGRRGRFLIEREYGWEKIAAEMSELYIQVLTCPNSMQKVSA
jgi:glycosyltransferase involved in cell wall biosynthesis